MQITPMIRFVREFSAARVTTGLFGHVGVSPYGPCDPCFLLKMS